MLTITLAGEEVFDEETNQFTLLKPTTVRLEHSLISLSKWESIHEKPFNPKDGKDSRTPEELKDYIRCMVIGEVSEASISVLWLNYSSEIQEYINSPNTATVVKKNGRSKGNKQFITSELIYSWLIAFNIPFETQKWHLNRLLTLIDICNEQQGKKKRVPKSQQYAKQRELNAQRRAERNSKG